MVVTRDFKMHDKLVSLQKAAVEAGNTFYDAIEAAIDQQLSEGRVAHEARTEALDYAMLHFDRTAMEFLGVGHINRAVEKARAAAVEGAETKFRSSAN